ncbi:unnamed protein product [Periconia digitata]|uniref:Uncharacterized protein n=1 Tax=Periconia digitata TaxID=1303443 RepID=A0A9W4UKQ6_9PLEO|nr:unnamed protein product [Periconia digitata]
MTWWRRDSSLWSRTPIHRYIRRTLADNETVLRTRCFSRSQPHDTGSGDRGPNRPTPSIDKDRIRSRQYDRWKLMLETDPYRALFGASERMLAGRGLVDWPSMVMPSDSSPNRDIGLEKADKCKISGEKPVCYHAKHDRPIHTRAWPPTEKHPQANAIRDDNYSWEKLGGDESNYGVDSPSDSRRPREQSTTARHPEDIRHTGRQAHDPSEDTIDSMLGNGIKKDEVRNQQYQHIQPVRHSEQSYKTSSTDGKLEDSRASNPTATIALGTSTLESRDSVPLQTSLQRRESFISLRKSGRQTDSSAVSMPPKDALIVKPANTNTAESSTTHSEETLATACEIPRRTVKSIHPSAITKTADENIKSQPRVTRDIHRLLPKDDIDFLTADAIRSSMGRVRNTQEDRTKMRERLEKKYEEGKRDDNHDEDLAQNVLSEQYIRRQERDLLQHSVRQPLSELEKAPETAESPENQEATLQMREDLKKTLTVDPAIRLLGRDQNYMITWLEAGGPFSAHHISPGSLKQHGQDMSTDPFFQGVLRGIIQSDRSMARVVLNLPFDLPASAPLVKRLRQSTISLTWITENIVKRGPTAGSHLQSKRIEKKVLIWKHKLLSLEKELEMACEDIDRSAAPQPLAKERLSVDADILQDFARLIRAMIFGLQTRIDRPGGLPIHLLNRVLTSLLGLQDIILAMIRLLTHAMTKYGINAKQGLDKLQKPRRDVKSGQKPVEEQFLVNDTKKDVKKREMKAAADAKLSAEVDSFKAAMRGLSDDGYSRTSKPVSSKSASEPRPLTNSLFRPFQSQLDDLGKLKASPSVESEMNKGGNELVKEVHSVYEELFGPFAIHHRQLPGAKETSVSNSETENGNEKILEDNTNSNVMEKAPSKSSTPQKQPTLQMLKEDEVSPIISSLACSSSTTAESIDPLSSRNEVEEVTTVTSPTPANISGPSSLPSVQPEHPDVNTEPIPESTVSHKLSYVTYMYDPTTDEIIISPTTSATNSSSTDDSTPIIPLHTALSTLTDPIKFLPHLPKSHTYEIITVRPTLLVLRSTALAEAAVFGEDTVRFPATPAPNPEIEGISTSSASANSEWTQKVNPIDGTTRLSPTGFAGPSSLELEQDFEERRRAAQQQQRTQNHHQQDQFAQQSSHHVGSEMERKPPKWARHKIKANEGSSSDMQFQAEKPREVRKKDRSGFSGVARSVVWAGAWCYMIGVLAEVLK